MPTVIEKSKATNKLEAIQTYLDREEAKRAVLARVDSSIDHYETTGLHATLEEMRDWSKSMRLDRNTQLPACHK